MAAIRFCTLLRPVFISKAAEEVLPIPISPKPITLQPPACSSVRAKGILTIHGVARERIIKSTLRVQGNTITVKSAFTILLSEHNITIPKIVYQKIAEEIKIEVDAEFNPIGTSTK